MLAWHQRLKLSACFRRHPWTHLPLRCQSWPSLDVNHAWMDCHSQCTPVLGSRRIPSRLYEQVGLKQAVEEVSKVAICHAHAGHTKGEDKMTPEMSHESWDDVVDETEVLVLRRRSANHEVLGLSHELPVPGLARSSSWQPGRRARDTGYRPPIFRSRWSPLASYRADQDIDTCMLWRLQSSRVIHPITTPQLTKH